MDIYYIKVWTFRRTLELRVWEKVSNITSWECRFDEENNCNVIWLRDYNLNTLIHELVHCVELMSKQVWIDVEWEPIAYIYEELFTKIMIQCWKKFKLDKDTKNFYRKQSDLFTNL